MSAATLCLTRSGGVHLAKEGCRAELTRTRPFACRIYLLNLFLAFLQPKFDPALAADIAESEVEEGAPGLPTSMPSPGAAPGGAGAYGELQDGEFRPFIRRLPEFKFWCVRRPGFRFPKARPAPG